MDHRTWLRRLADPAKRRAPSSAPACFRRSASSARQRRRCVAVGGHPSRSRRLSHGVDRYHSLYVADQAGVLAGKPKLAQGVRPVGAGGGNRDQQGLPVPADREGRAALQGHARARCRDSTSPPRETRHPQRATEVITGIAAAREGSTSRAAKARRRSSSGAATASDAEPQADRAAVRGQRELADALAAIPDGVVLELSAWTRVGRPLPAGRRGRAARRAARSSPPGKYDAPAGVVAREVRVKSHDGVEVPVSILARTDVKLDGSNPTHALRLRRVRHRRGARSSTRACYAWLEQRRRATRSRTCAAAASTATSGISPGWKATKPNTWKDGIAVAEWLIANGYTRSRLSIYGGSAGGIFVGRAITERPDLFAAAVVGGGQHRSSCAPRRAPTASATSPSTAPSGSRTSSARCVR